MANAPTLLFVGGECITRFGALSQSTAIWEENAEVHTRGVARIYTDRDGSTNTAEVDVPRVTWIDQGSGETDTPALLLGTSDVIYWEHPIIPSMAPFTLYWSGRQLAAMAAADGLWHMGSATAATDPRLLVISNGTNYSAIYDDGVTTLTATLAAAPADTNDFEIRVVFDPLTTGILIGQSVSSAAETTATDTNTALAASAFADSRIYLNSTGTSNVGDTHVYAAKIEPGIKTLAEMRAL